MNFWFHNRTVDTTIYGSKQKYTQNIPVLVVQQEHAQTDAVVGSYENVSVISMENCEVIHVAFVCSGYKSVLFFHTTLKSIFFYRENPIHFHIITNQFSEIVIRTLFDTWNVPNVNVTFYDFHQYLLDVRWVPNWHYSGIYGLLKLVIPKILLGTSVQKVIVLDTDLIFVGDIFELWKLFNNFTNIQALGLVENQSDYYLGKLNRMQPWPAIGRGFNTGVMLYNLQVMNKIGWSQLWTEVTKTVAATYGELGLGDQDVMNAVIKYNPKIVFHVPCYWNTQLSDHTLSRSLCYRNNKVKVIHWNSPKKINVVNKDASYFQTLYTTFLEYNGNLLRRQLHDCQDFQRKNIETSSDVCSKFHKGHASPWRTLLFFREFKYTVTSNDITLVAQLSYDRLQMIEDLVKYWKGPISFTLYVSDPEFQESISYIENCEILRDRVDIAYHAVFKDGELHPINMLRNVGLKNVNTPYVFLTDVDFLPMRGLYDVLKNHIKAMGSLKNKALIIPAFETQRYKIVFPKNKKHLLEMLDRKYIFPFRFDVWTAGHAPINYTKWRVATSPYKVEWKPDFEPYIVVRSDVTEYDPRFMGFGWNKVSHIMELEAQSYDFIVLDDTFIIHKSHAPSYDIAKFRSSPIYRMCLQNMKEEFVETLQKKYKRVFNNHNSSILVTK